MPPKRMFSNDMWTVDDQLGFKQTGDQVARLSLLADPPFTIGVLGKWGSGKTSLLRYVMARLGGKCLWLPGYDYSLTQEEENTELSVTSRNGEAWKKLRDEAHIFIHGENEELCPNSQTPVEDCPLRVVWFNPWQYQNESNPLVPLLHEIRQQFTGWKKLQGKGKKVARVAFETGLNLLGKLADAALTVGIKAAGADVKPSLFGKLTQEIRTLGERYEKEHLETMTDAQRFSLLFEEAIRILLSSRQTATEQKKGEPVGRLVILIDDLDRCSNGAVVNLLEAIKLYLSTRYCVFVLGLDYSAVLQALRASGHYNEVEVREYLEKLFQGRVRVPICYKPEAYLLKLLQERHFPDTSEGTLTLLTSLMEKNPRKIKNFINSLASAWMFLETRIQSMTETPDFLHQWLIVLTYLRLYHPQVYRILELEPRTLKDLMAVLTNPHQVLQPGPLGNMAHHSFCLQFYDSFRHILDRYTLPVTSSASEESLWQEEEPMASPFGDVPVRETRTSSLAYELTNEHLKRLQERVDQTRGDAALREWLQDNWSRMQQAIESDAVQIEVFLHYV